MREHQLAEPLEISVVPIHDDRHETAAVAPFRPAVAAEPRRGRKRYLAALAIPALLAIGIAPALWERAARTQNSGARADGDPGSDQCRSSSLRNLRRRAATRRQSPPAAVTPGQEAASSQPAGAAPAAAIPPAAASEGLRPTLPPAAGQVRPPQGNAPRPVDNGPRDGSIERVSAGSVVASPVRGLPDGPAYSPSFASVGSAMFYQAESGGRSALMRADTDSRGAILRITSVVDDRAQNFHARQSPDGSLIAFDSDRDGERGVYIADSDGQNVRRISGDGFAAIPSWSPDGKTIAFVRAEADRSEGVEPVDRGRRLRSRSPAHVLPLRRSLGWLLVS